MLRRVTLVWTNLLNISPAPASRSPMQHSKACNCSSLQITEFFFWNALEMRDNFGIAICFDKSLLHCLLGMLLRLLHQPDIFDDELQLGEDLVHIVAEIQ
uniref:Uncharacterized protein n=1 Tax=Oryza punctata TaxID=4537 RepID=A0A0E0LXT4_ORYPU